MTLVLSAVHGHTGVLLADRRHLVRPAAALQAGPTWAVIEGAKIWRICRPRGQDVVLAGGLEAQYFLTVLYALSRLDELNRETVTHALRDNTAWLRGLPGGIGLIDQVGRVHVLLAGPGGHVLHLLGGADGSLEELGPGSVGVTWPFGLAEESNTASRTELGRRLLGDVGAARSPDEIAVVFRAFAQQTYHRLGPDGSISSAVDVVQLHARAPNQSGSIPAEAGGGGWNLGTGGVTADAFISPRAVSEDPQIRALIRGRR